MAHARGPASNMSLLNEAEPGWPICAVCNRKVDRFMAFRDSFRDAVTFVAWCHGEETELQLPLSNIEGAYVRLCRYVFAPPKLVGE